MADIDIANPGGSRNDLTDALASYQRRAVDWLDQNNSTPSAGTIDTTGAPYTNTLAIVGVNQGTKTFSVVGNYAGPIPGGSALVVTGSTGNDGTYTVSSATFNTPNTDIVVVEAIPNAVVDGNLTVNGALAGQSTLIAYPSAPADSGIWVLGSVVAPAAVPVTRRADAPVGATFIQNETIALNPVNAVANLATYANVMPLNPTYTTAQEVAIVGTDIIQFNDETCGESSVVGGGFGNVASGKYATIAGGTSNLANGTTNATIGGGTSNIASANQTTIGGGGSNTASGASSTVAGGNDNIADGDYSDIPGGNAGRTRGITGISVKACGVFAIEGDAQRARYLLRGITVGAVANQLCADGSGPPAAALQVTLPPNSSYSFTGRITAREPATGATSVRKFEGAIKQGANATATALVAAVTPAIVAEDAALSTMALAITADTTVGCLAVTVTGIVLLTIQYVCDIETVENVG